jgi:hypothetical protein
MRIPSLENVIAKLVSERKKLQRKLGEIETVFKKFGIRVADSGTKAFGGGKKSGAVAKAKGTKKRKRGKFKQTAENYILGLLKGGKGLTTAQINARWKKVGRGGGSNVTLSKMVKDKQIKRTSKKGVRGSTYSIA